MPKVSSLQDFLLPTRCPICKGGSGKNVCGSDHKTYSSLCELRAAACKQKKAIIVLKNGACETTSDELEDEGGVLEDEDARFPDEVEDEDDNDAHEDDDQD